MSGAEIAQIIQNARMVAIREFVTKSKDSEDVTDDTILKNLMLTSAHIDEAFELSKPSRKQPYDHRPPGISELSDIDVI
ncbi:MAG: hypothetical protein ACW98K_07395 [Candidatus Kariarchaeaceae archaeon]